MEQDKLEEAQLRLEHEWTQQHVQSWLKDGMAYTIILNDNTRITNAIFHYCTLSGDHYFARGVGIYPIEKVYSHSLIGCSVPAKTEPIALKQTPINPDHVAITDYHDEIINVITTSETNPITFQHRVKCLMLSGLPQDEAEKVASTIPMKLELFYEVGLGIFAIDSEAVGNTPLYSPYTGREIPDETT